MVGLNLLRRIEAQASTRAIRKVRIELHPELADAFQNTRRREIAELEEEFDLKIEVIASSSLHRPEQEIEWFERSPGPVAPKGEPDRPAKAQTSAPAELPAAEGKKPRKRRRRRHRNGHGGEESVQSTEEPSTLHSPSDESGEAIASAPDDTAWVWISNEDEDGDSQSFADESVEESSRESEVLAGEAMALPQSNGTSAPEGEVRRGRKRRRRKKRPVDADKSTPATDGVDAGLHVSEASPDSGEPTAPEADDAETDVSSASSAGASAARRPRRRYRRRGRKHGVGAAETAGPPNETS